MSKDNRKPSEINDDYDHIVEGRPEPNGAVYLLIVVVALILGGITLL